MTLWKKRKVPTIFLLLHCFDAKSIPIINQFQKEQKGTTQRVIVFYRTSFRFPIQYFIHVTFRWIMMLHMMLLCLRWLYGGCTYVQELLLPTLLHQGFFVSSKVHSLCIRNGLCSTDSWLKHFDQNEHIKRIC